MTYRARGPRDRGSSVRRLLEFIALLSDGRVHTWTEFCALGGVSRRTVYRDMQTISAAGFYVEIDFIEKGRRGADLTGFQLVNPRLARDVVSLQRTV